MSVRSFQTAHTNIISSPKLLGQDAITELGISYEEDDELDDDDILGYNRPKRSEQQSLIDFLNSTPPWEQQQPNKNKALTPQVSFVKNSSNNSKSNISLPLSVSSNNHQPTSFIQKNRNVKRDSLEDILNHPEGDELVEEDDYYDEVENKNSSRKDGLSDFSRDLIDFLNSEPPPSNLAGSNSQKHNSNQNLTSKSSKLKNIFKTSNVIKRDKEKDDRSSSASSKTKTNNHISNSSADSHNSVFNTGSKSQHSNVTILNSNTNGSINSNHSSTYNTSNNNNNNNSNNNNININNNSNTINETNNKLVSCLLCFKRIKFIANLFN